jgi:predicted oxidoreductase
MICDRGEKRAWKKRRLLRLFGVIAFVSAGGQGGRGSDVAS